MALDSDCKMLVNVSAAGQKSEQRLLANWTLLSHSLSLSLCPSMFLFFSWQFEFAVSQQ